VTASITFSDLFTYAIDDPSVHLPLSDLDRGAGHIHGLLRVAIGERVLPHMGFFGPHDVCLNTWVEELRNVLRSLDVSAGEHYLFDEGEQGQPAFEFKRQGDILAVSVCDSQLSGAQGDPSFQRVCCMWSEFRSAIEQFLIEFRQVVLAQCPAAGASWWVQHVERAA
jgi:hypothetical protein